MRVLSVVPRYAVTVGSLKARRGGTVIGKTREERGSCIKSAKRSTLVEDEQNTYSERTYKRNVQLQKRNTSRNGGENMSAELDEKYENAWHSVA